MQRQKDKIDILNPGDVFEKYTVEKLLGKGGMGAVYLVRHNVLDSLFALKVLFPDVACANSQYVERFIREARLACKIKHPNLITVHDAGKNKENGMYYLVMDYVSGGNVRDLLKLEGKLSQKKALSIIEQITGALNEAYKYKMVHRDIKPDNIMFTTDGIAKLADLGIAKSANDQDTKLTIDASIFGTPAYMSPEQAMDSSKVDCRADIYSMGIVLFEMLTGQRPYKGGGTIEILSQILKDENIPDVRDICPEILESVAFLIRDMTAKQLKNRIATPSVLLKRLQDIDNSMTLEESTNRTESFSYHSDPTMLTSLDKTLPTIVPNVGSIAPQITIPTIVDNEEKIDDSNFTRDNTSELIVEKATILSSTLGGGAGNAHKNETNIISEQAVSKSKNWLNFLWLKGICNSLFKKNEISNQFEKKKKNILLGGGVIVLVVAISIFGVLLLSKPKEHNPHIANVSNTENTSQVVESTILKKEPIFSATESFLPLEKDNEEIIVSQELESNDLIPGSIVILGHLESKNMIKKNLTDSNIVFREAEILSRYRQQLLDIIKSKPRYVVLIPAIRYAELNVSLASFENLIREEATMLRDNSISFMFVLTQSDVESPKVNQFNLALQEFCNLKSLPLLSSEKNVMNEIKLLMDQK